jgi:ribosomal protein S6--L-glutamate ligase
MASYLTLVKLMQQKGVVCLHSHYHEIILNDKMLQSTYFASSNVPIPDTYQVFGVPSAKELAYTRLSGPTIVKHLNDYGGDSVFKVDDKWNVVNAVAKNLWKGEHVILQKMISDSIGQSIRVLCIEGKAFAMMTYEDESGDFRSNVSMGQNFKCTNLMNHPKFKSYKDIAEKAISSIGDVLIGGVDILDSKSEGVVVLEINSFPDVYDIWYHTKMCTFKRLAEAFMNKIRRSIDKENVEIVFLE